MFTRIIKDILQPPNDFHYKIKTNAPEIVQSVSEFTMATLFYFLFTYFTF